jgi:hypothetical protein
MCMCTYVHTPNTNTTQNHLVKHLNTHAHWTQTHLHHHLCVFQCERVRVFACVLILRYMRALVGWLSASLRTCEADALEEAKGELRSSGLLSPTYTETRSSVGCIRICLVSFRILFVRALIAAMFVASADVGVMRASANRVSVSICVFVLVKQVNHYLYCCWRTSRDYRGVFKYFELSTNLGKLKFIFPDLTDTQHWWNTQTFVWSSLPHSTSCIHRN